jgi:predicted dehydrogenase
MKNTRRGFIKNITTGSAAIAFGGLGLGFSSKSYGRIKGANDRISVGVMGTNGRGRNMARLLEQQPNTDVSYICDVDDRALEKGVNAVKDVNGRTPKAEKNIFKVLEDKNVDAMLLAPPDHWHVPATILSCVAGKHVYVEKPLGHNPREGELAIEAARKYERVVQMGSQRRSGPKLIEGINELKSGVIGKVYMAKTWYTNNRKSIGVGKLAEVPSTLDYELWQGPAPRRPYKDNLIHYNWHWSWHWGTGEALNNGTHEVDVARWGLGLDYPQKVNSVGGRYHFNDDWETPDTQIITYECDGASVVWEGRSCNGTLVEGEDRGVIFYGEHGTMRTGGNSYVIYDLQGKLVKEVTSDIVMDGRDIASPSVALDTLHIANFLDCIRYGNIPNCDVEIGYKSTLWVQLGNIAQRVGHTLNIDQTNGHILEDTEAMKLWSREYEPGWEPKI